MRDLVFDTETTGIVNFKNKDYRVQPYLVQLAAQLIEDDRVVAEINLITIPEHNGVRFPVPPVVEAIHGISDALIDRVGFSYKVAIPMFHNMLRRADRLVAHNMAFDFAIMKAAYSRINGPQDRLLQIPKICTMLTAKPVLKLPGKYGYKWPSLDASYRFLVDPDGFDDAHDAMADTRACAAILKALENNGS